MAELRLTKNFSLIEYRCKGKECKKSPDLPQMSIQILLQLLRYALGKQYCSEVRIKIVSGNRCFIHNEIVQLEADKDYIPGSSESAHMLYNAADIKCYYKRYNFDLYKYEWNQIEPIKIHKFLDNQFPFSLGLGIYNNRNHLDARQDKSRWDKRDIKEPSIF